MDRCDGVLLMKDKPNAALLRVYAVVDASSTSKYLVFYPDDPAQRPGVQPLGSASLWEIKDAYWDGGRLKIAALSSAGRFVWAEELEPAFFLALIKSIRSMGTHPDPLHPTVAARIDKNRRKHAAAAATMTSTSGKQQSQSSNAKSIVVGSYHAAALRPPERRRPMSPMFDFASWSPEGTGVPKLEQVAMSEEDARALGIAGGTVDIGTWIVDEVDGKATENPAKPFIKHWAVVQPDDEGR